MSHPNPLASTAKILEELKAFPNGVTAVAFSMVMGRSMQSPLSKLYAYGVIDRVPCPDRKPNVQAAYLYRTKLPRALAPPTVTEAIAAEFVIRKVMVEL